MVDMALVNTEITAAEERAARNARLAQAFGSAGKASRAERLSQRASQQQAKAQQASSVLNRNVPSPSGSVEYVQQKDRRNNKTERGTYEPVTVRTEGNLTVVERRALLTDRGDRYTKQQPYVKERLVVDATGEIISREVYDTYKTEGGRERAYLLRKETPTQEREIRRDSGGSKVADVKINKERGTIREENVDAPSQEELRSERQAQRDRFTGEGAEITAVQDEQGQTFQGSVQQGVFVGLRTVSEQEQALEAKRERLTQTRVNPGLLFSPRGAVLVRQGARGGKTAAETFEDLGAPKTVARGSIVFVRRPEKTIVEQGTELLTGKEVKKPFSEKARESVVTETIYDVPNAASATFAGLPSKDIRFPARFSVLQETRTDYARPGLLERNAPKTAAALERGSAKLLSIDERAVELALNEPEGRGKPIRRVRELGGLLEKGGVAIQKGGDVVEEIGFKGDKSNVFPIAAKGVRVAGEFVQGEGLLLQRRPVTGGVGEAVIVGAGFGLVRKGAVAAEALGTRTGLPALRLLGKGTRVTESVVGAGLGGAYVVQTGKELSTASAGAERGTVLAQGVNELVGFGAGVKLGGKIVTGTGAGLRKGEATLREIGRAGTVGGRSAKQRSGRITQAELRNRKQQRALAPKYEVTRDLDTTTFALRGKARERTDELRILEKQAQRERVDTVQFFEQRGVQGVVKGRETVTRVRATDIALPGERSPRIEPVPGRERARTVSQDPGRRGRLKVAGTGRVPLTLGPVRASNAATGSTVETTVLARLRKPRKELVNSATPQERVRERLGESQYRQRVAVRTVSPEFVGAPEIVPGPNAGGRFSYGSPEYRRQLALTKLREAGARRQEFLAREAVKPTREIQILEEPVRKVRVQGSAIGRALRSGSLSSQSLSLGEKVRGVPKIGLASVQRSSLREASLLSQSQASLQAQGQIQRQESLQVQAQEQLAAQSLVNRFKSRTRSIPRVATIGRTTEPVPRPPRVDVLRLPRTPRTPRTPLSPVLPETPLVPRAAKLTVKQEGSEEGYAVLVKRRGKFTRLAIPALSKQEALIVGAGAVDKSAAQTFELVLVRERVRKKSLREFDLANALSKVRKLEGTSGRELYREKRKFAIDTGGEYAQISLRGQQARRSGKLLRAVGL